MNLKVLGGIVLFSGSIWYLYNKYIKSTISSIFNIFPTNNVDIDTVILSMVDKEILVSLFRVNKYLTNIINTKSFWKLRMKSRLGLITKNDNINFRLITNLFDNNKSFRDNTAGIINHEYFKEIYYVLGENKKVFYIYRFAENKDLQGQINDINKILHERLRIKENGLLKQFLTKTNLSINLINDLKFFTILTNIVEIKTKVNFRNNDENIVLRCNKPLHLVILLFELYQKLEIKNISITNPYNNSDEVNQLLYETIKSLT